MYCIARSIALMIFLWTFQSHGEVDTSDIVQQYAAQTRKYQDSFLALPAIITQVAKADEVKAFKGLPYKQWEKDQLAHELKTQRTVMQHGFAVYADPITLAADDIKHLKALLVDRKSFDPYIGPKSCGGCGPDYALHWRAGDTTVEIQLCLGCSEMMAYMGKTEVHCDLSSKAREKFEKILSKYKKVLSKQSKSTE